MALIRTINLHIEFFAMQLHTWEFTLTACIAVSHALQCAADRHSGDSDLTLKQYCVCMVCILCKFKTFNDQNANLIRWNVLQTLS